MTYPFPYGGISVTRERPTFDRFNDVSGYTELVIPNCVEFPVGTDEGPNNTGITDSRTLLVPAGSDIKAIDRIVLHYPGEDVPPTDPIDRRANTFQVKGRPKSWVHAMTGWNPGMTVELERIT